MQWTVASIRASTGRRRGPLHRYCRAADQTERRPTSSRRLRHARLPPGARRLPACERLRRQANRNRRSSITALRATSRLQQLFRSPFAQDCRQHLTRRPCLRKGGLRPFRVLLHDSLHTRLALHIVSSRVGWLSQADNVNLASPWCKHQGIQAPFDQAKRLESGALHSPCGDPPRSAPCPTRTAPPGRTECLAGPYSARSWPGRT